MLQLDEFDFRPHRAGFQAVSLFENNFGCSILPETDMVHYEVAVLEHDAGRNSHICYTSGLTDDVFRLLDVGSVHAVVEKIRGLPKGTKVY